MTGYTRQSTANMVSGNTIFASDLNAEFNQLQSAMDGTTGHTHDGSTGSGPKISLTSSVIGVLPTANGGTGGVLPIANGGTSATTATAAVTALGAAHIAGDTFTGTVQAPTLVVTGNPATPRPLLFSSGTLARWGFIADSVAESGANSGSNLFLYRYNDAGSSIDSPLSINRATGLTTVSSIAITAASVTTLTMTGNILDAKFAASASPTKQVQLDTSGITAGNTRNVRIPDIDTTTGLWEPIGDYTLTASSSVSVTNLSAFKKIRITGLVTHSSSSQLFIRTSTNNGSTYDSGASDYLYQFIFAQNSTPTAFVSSGTLFPLLANVTDTAERSVFNILLEGFNKAVFMSVIGDSFNVNSTTPNLSNFGGRRQSATARNAFQISPSAGTITGTITIEGVRG